MQYIMSHGICFYLLDQHTLVKSGRRQNIEAILTEKLRLVLTPESDSSSSLRLSFCLDLQSYTRAITPPLDEEEVYEEARIHEAAARTELEADNCPPCYPSHISVPFTNIPQKYKKIVSHWSSCTFSGDSALAQQLADWKAFRKFQRRNRHYYQDKPYSAFVDNINQRRRKHKLEEVSLLPNAEQRIPMDEWTEFEDYHIRYLDQLQKEQEDWEADARISDAKDAMAIEHRLRYSRWQVEQQKILLSWIAEQRQETNTNRGRCATDMIEPGASPKVNRMSARNRGMLQPQAHPVDRNAGILKHKRGTLKRPSRKLVGKQDLENARLNRALGMPIDKDDSDAISAGKVDSIIPPDIMEVRTTRSGRASRPPSRWGSE